MSIAGCLHFDIAVLLLVVHVLCCVHNSSVKKQFIGGFLGGYPHEFLTLEFLATPPPTKQLLMGKQWSSQSVS